MTGETTRKFSPRDYQRRKKADQEGAAPPDAVDPPIDAEPEDPACPLIPLGQRDGQYYFIGKSGEVRVVSPRDLTANGILSLFDGDEGWLCEHFAELDRKRRPTGDFQVKRVAAWLIRTCAAAGIFDASTAVRGVGVWRTQRGNIAVHCGDEIWTAGRWQRAGIRMTTAIYTACPPVPRPMLPPQETPATAREAATLYEALKLWTYVVPRGADGGSGYDPARLLFGWVAVAMLGAAPHWRVHALLSGPRGSGKSMLFDLISAALGPQAYGANDFTEAGLRQALTGQARALMLDEMEGDIGEGRVEAVILLLRRMSSGEGLQAVRGGAGGRDQQFALSTSAFMSAINAPQLQPQDRSRIFEVELAVPVGRSAESPLRAIEEAGRLSAALRGRAVMGWQRFQDNLAVLHAQLLEAGCDGRQADQLGTLLAAADMMLSDLAIDPDSAREAVDTLRPLISQIQDEDFDDSDARQCFGTLMTRHIDHWRGGSRSTIGRLVQQAMDDTALDERKALRVYGLRLERAPPTDPAFADIEAPYLLVANRHEGLSAVYKDTRWRGGGWRRALLRLNGARAAPDAVNFDGFKARCVIVPNHHLPRPERESPPDPHGDEGGP